MDSSGTATNRVLIALPALNEAESIGSVIATLRGLYPHADILVVDDGSTDGTGAVAAAAGAQVCRLPFNLGVGGAMRAAFKHALRGDYDAVVQVDADGQHDPRYVADLLSGLAHADVVVGARFAGVGDYHVAWSRRLAMRLLARAISRLAKTELTDVTSGFRAANRRAIQVFAAHYPAEYLGDTVESLVIAVRTGCVIRQVPVEMSCRLTGHASQSTFRSGIFLARAVVALALAMFRSWPTPQLQRTAELEVTS